MSVKVNEPMTLIDKVEQFLQWQKLSPIRHGEQLWVLAGVEKASEKTEVAHLFQEQPPGILRVYSSISKTVPPSKQRSLAILFSTASPLDPGSLAVTPGGYVRHVLSVPMTVKRATRSRLEKLYLDIMISLDPAMNLLSETE